nr:reverse transcriptase domain-containing protein [Tanacetum cinerariifolium]
RSDSYNRRSHSWYTGALSESEDSEGEHWKSRSKKKKSSGEEDDLSQPWVYEETDPFTPRIRYFVFPKTRMPSHIKTYNRSEDPEDHLKNFQAAAKTERWAMPTWCHMFNSTLTENARVWFDDLPPESIDSYDDLKKAFLKNYLQQKKYIKDLIELHNIKQRDGESTKDFVRRYKLERRDVKGAPECMRIFGFVHGITNPKLIKCLHDKIPKTVDEMMRVTTSFHRGKVAASYHERKKIFPPWKQHESSQKQNFKKEGFRNQQRSKRKQDRFSLLTKTPKEFFALDKGKFKALPPMTTPSPYNGIIGRPGVRKLQAVPSTAHGMLKIPVEGGVITLKSSKLVPLECAMVFGPAETPSATKPIAEERVKVAINPEYPKQTPADMTGVPRHIAEHRLNLRKGCSPIKQKKRGQAADRNQAIQEEVEKLVGAGIIRDVHYHDWLSNLVMGIFCYTKMSFGLRNAGATYQRLVDKAFHKQIGRNLEVYVDDLVIKSRTEEEIVRDVEETFKTLRKINMKLNPKKCAFGVEEEMFLEYKVNAKGLKVCPDKVDVVLGLPSPKCLKDVQKLNGKLASLNRFLAKSAEKSLPFFKILKKRTKKSDFYWTTKAEEAFKQMKHLIAKLPMLTAPMEKEELIVYLAAAKETGIKRPGTQLHVNEKVGTGLSTC